MTSSTYSMAKRTCSAALPVVCVFFVCVCLHLCRSGSSESLAGLQEPLLGFLSLLGYNQYLVSFLVRGR